MFIIFVKKNNMNIEKLIKLAKQESMFETAFLIASKYNLEKELFNLLKKNYDLSFDEFELLFFVDTTLNTNHIDILYNLINISLKSEKSLNLDLEENKKLEFIYCIFCDINSLNLTNNPNLKKIVFNNCTLPNIDFSKNINIENVKINMSKIETIDLSNQLKLKTVECRGKHIKTLFLNENIKDNVELKISNNVNIIYK